MTDPTRWIWNGPTWPKLRYDQDLLVEALGRARDMAGRLRGRADAIGEDELTLIEGEVWAGNAVATSAIEGEVLDMAAVRSSVASRLGAAPALVTPVSAHDAGMPASCLMLRRFIVSFSASASRRHSVRGGSSNLIEIHRCVARKGNHQLKIATERARVSHSGRFMVGPITTCSSFRLTRRSRPPA